MKPPSRIFIKNLPTGATQPELQTIFAKYGEVKSIDIKERKNTKFSEESPFFAYINLETDDRSLQKCFQYFSKNLFHGESVDLQIAKESFLDRLKREREQSGSSQPTIQHVSPKTDIKPKFNAFKNENNSHKRKLFTEEEQPSVEIVQNDINKEISEPVLIKEVPVPSDMIIKNNKNKVIDKNGLKIESVGKKPILVINKSKVSKANGLSESDKKRMESLANMRKGYQNQKLTIKAALSKIDVRPPDEIKKLTNEDGKKKKPALFDEEDQSDEDSYNFQMKSQFEGKKGSELMELQSKYKNDSRFKLDERFIGDTEEADVEQPEADSLAAEKQREFEILNQVLGGSVKPKPTRTEPERQKRMLRFDPTQPEHSRYERKKPEEEPKTKRKRKQEETEEVLEPEVSKEVFYKVENNFKQTMEESKGFSLLETFGTAEPTEEVEEEQAKEITKLKRTDFDSNPFHYDSSDDEKDEPVEDVKKVEDAQEKPKSSLKLFQEPFFFKDDDYRLDEGRDFVLRLSTTESSDFHQLRRELKQITRTKLKHIQKSNQPFKKKLGGASTKQKLRFKRALKR